MEYKRSAVKEKLYFPIYTTTHIYNFPLMPLHNRMPNIKINRSVDINFDNPSLFSLNVFI
jgi:hypothetical protein